MGLVINTNVASLLAQRHVSQSSDAVTKSVERLSSGLRVVRASDDAAGLGMSETLRAQIRSLTQAVRNANDGISLLQIADGAAATINNLIARMRELATQSSSGSVGVTERSYLDNEFVALRSEIDRIAVTTELNNVKLLSGTNTITLQVGFRSSANDQLSLALNDLQTAALSISSTNISTAANAASAIANIDSAISAVATARSEYGFYTNRLQATIDSLQVTSENFAAADSRIRDLDVAFETAVFTRNQVLVQSGIAVLAQANILPQQALALLR